MPSRHGTTAVSWVVGGRSFLASGVATKRASRRVGIAVPYTTPLWFHGLRLGVRLMVRVRIRVRLRVRVKG